MTRRRDPLRDFDAFDPALLHRQHGRERGITAAKLVAMFGGNFRTFAEKYGTSGLVSYWKLEEASGSRADSFGTNTLTDNNTVTQAAGKLGQAGLFTQANTEYLSIASNTGLQFGEKDWTLTAWIKLTSKSVSFDLQALITKNSIVAGTREMELMYRASTDVFMAIVFSAVDVQSADIAATNFGSPTIGVWYFVAVTYTVATNAVAISVNAGTQNTGVIGATLQSSTAEFWIGASAYAGFPLPADAAIDSIGRWNRVLSADEISYLYNGGTGRPIVGTEP